MKTTKVDQQSLSIKTKHYSVLNSVGNVHLNLIAEMKAKIEKLENDICRYRALEENGNKLNRFFGGYNFEIEALH